MTERNFLCKCTFCLNEDINGKILNQNTFNRHRARIQEFSERDDENMYIEENIPLDMEENIHLDMKENIHLDAEKSIHLNTEENIYLDTEENIHLNMEENIYLDTEEKQIEKNIDDDSDTESFNFNEEDIEYYSDYNNDDDNNNDNNDNNSNGDDNNDKESDNDENDDSDDDKSDDDESNDNKSDDDDESDDDKSDDKSDDNENMQIDDETNIPNKKIIEGLKLLYLKSLYNFTESAYDDIIKIFTTNNLSLYKIKKYLKDITGLVPVFYDMCENSCICYTGQYETYQNCPICESTRLDIRGKAKKIMPYLSIKNRLQMQFNDGNRAKELLYRHEYIINKHNDDDDDLDDIFDGKIYKELVEENLFNDKRDIAFTASCDEYQIFKQKTDDCWLFLMINNNLDPSLRVKKENLMIPFLIPGPNQPKDFNTFLQPFIDEMKELESKYFYLNLFIVIKIN